MSLICPYCKNEASFVVDGSYISIYYTGTFWLCAPCDAYISCYNNTNIPRGTLANLELRQARIEAHNLFDPLWKDKIMSRTEAYQWLREKMNLSKDECHISKFDLDQCNRAIEVMKNG